MKIELNFGTVWHDVSSSLIKDSLKIISKAMTEERKSTLNLCNFSLLWNSNRYTFCIFSIRNRQFKSF